jgi:hypothetical protein
MMHAGSVGNALLAIRTYEFMKARGIELDSQVRVI